VPSEDSTKGSQATAANSDEEGDDYGFFEQKGVPYRVTIQKMKDLIFDHIMDFVEMDPA